MELGDGVSDIEEVKVGAEELNEGVERSDERPVDDEAVDGAVSVEISVSEVELALAMLDTLGVAERLEGVDEVDDADEERVVKAELELTILVDVEVLMKLVDLELTGTDITTSVEIIVVAFLLGEDEDERPRVVGVVFSVERTTVDRVEVVDEDVRSDLSSLQKLSFAKAPNDNARTNVWEKKECMLGKDEF